jgi:uncharacterized membrane protein HdeD (DUF308 family)
MIKDLVKDWWVFVLQGLLAIGVGLAAILVPGVTLTAFIAVFAAYAIVAGILSVIAGLAVSRRPRWSLVLGGIAGIAIGALTIAQPDNTALAVVLLVGIYAIATGLGEIMAAYTLGRLSNTVWLGLSGLISIVFGVLLIAAPSDGVLALLWLVAFYAIFAGVTLIAFGIRLRGAGEDVSAFEATVDRALGAGSGNASSGNTSSATTSAGGTGSGS